METIFSLVTKKTNQNVAIIRISGDDCYLKLQKIFGKEFKRDNFKIEYINFFYEKKFVDNLIALKFSNPKSFTGEDLVELQFHGSIYLIEKITRILISLGIRQANPGEFSLRSVLNGKMNITQAISINQIIKSESKQMFDASQENLNNKSSKEMRKLREEILSLLAIIQVSIDYPDVKDVKKYSTPEIIKVLEDIKDDLGKVIINSKGLQYLEEGFVISIIGIPNSGKSTTFNELIKFERSIVTDIPGTTRDIIDSTIFLNDYKLIIKDTAGIRETKSIVEKQGIKKVQKAINDSSLIIVLITPEVDFSIQEKELSGLLNDKKNVIFILNKFDKLDSKSKENVSEKIRGFISAKNKDILDLKNIIIEEIEKGFDLNYKNSSLTTKLEIINFEEINKTIKGIILNLKKGFTLDVLTYEIELILKKMDIMLGEEFSEDYFEKIFKNFCLGK